jgi:hypothetical protein
MSAIDTFTMIRPATRTAMPAEDSAPLPASLVLVIAINAIAGFYLMISGIDLSAFVAM